MSGAIVPLLLFLFSSLSPVILDFERDADQLGSEQIPSASGPAGLWDGLDQPWGQYGRTPTHNGTMPAHAPDGVLVKEASQTSVFTVSSIAQS